MRGRCVLMTLGLLSVAACAAPTTAALEGTRPLDTTAAPSTTRPPTVTTSASRSDQRTALEIPGSMITMDLPFGFRSSPSFPTLTCGVRATCGSSFLSVLWYRVDVGQEPATRLRAELERTTSVIGPAIESEADVSGRPAQRLDFDVNPPTTAYAFTADLYVIIIFVRSDPTASEAFDALRNAAEHARVGTEIATIDPGWTYDTSDLQLQANGPGWSILGKTDRASDQFPALSIARGCYGAGTTVSDPPDEVQLRTFAEDGLDDLGAGADGGVMTSIGGEPVWEAVGPLVKDGVDRRAWSVALLRKDSYLVMSGQYPAAAGQQGLDDARRLRESIRFTDALDNGLRCR